ncbi:hypothetical protein BD410DRAFT_797022 [Rickenella mellea]|uniref:Uncharacterized protein n=1 Tax=Rickenella mellea TaxID=50990 RepID=A0A4Y7PHT2_9AGAM|nr:hypothetical protein BD410DRAFT_797022 [Rickenella mellea]
MTVTVDVDSALSLVGLVGAGVNIGGLINDDRRGGGGRTGGEGGEPVPVPVPDGEEAGGPDAVTVTYEKVNEDQW